MKQYLDAKDPELPPALSDDLGDRLSNALGLLYTYDKPDPWYALASAFNFGRANGRHAAQPRLRARDLFAQSIVEHDRWIRTAEDQALKLGLDLLDQAIQLDPVTDYLKIRVDLAGEGDDAHRAIAASDALIAAQPKDPLAYWKRAMLNFNLGKYVEAVADIEASDRLEAQSYRPVWEALSYLRMGDRRRAQLQIDDGLKWLREPTPGGAEIVLAFLNGSLTHDAFIAAMVNSEPGHSTGKRCAAQVFAGERALGEGRLQAARDLLSTASSLCLSLPSVAADRKLSHI